LEIWSSESLEAACDEDSVDDEASWDEDAGDDVACDDEETSEPWEDLPAAESMDEELAVESMEDEVISASWGNRISSDVAVPSHAMMSMAAEAVKIARVFWTLNMS
jgi:hypothetical protein